MKLGLLNLEALGRIRINEKNNKFNFNLHNSPSKLAGNFNMVRSNFSFFSLFLAKLKSQTLKKGCYATFLEKLLFLELKPVRLTINMDNPKSSQTNNE